MSQTVCIYNFGCVTHRDDWNFKIPGSVFWRIYRIRRGNAYVRIHDRLRMIRPGHLYLIPAYTAHEDILEGEFIHDYLHFRLDGSFMAHGADDYDLAFEVESTPLTDAIFGRIGELCRGFELETALPQAYEKKSSYLYWGRRYESLPLCDRLELGGYVRSLLAVFLRNSVRRRPVDNPRVAAGKAFLDEHTGDPVTIEDAAVHAGMRPESFVRAFRQAYGRTPHTYLTSRRLDKAKDLLLLTPMSIKEIAAKCGFCDSSYFCLVFKRNISVSPGVYRHGQASSITSQSRIASPSTDSLTSVRTRCQP